jgi:hypothetical protein
MDYTNEITGHTVWRATVWRTTSGATPYLGPDTGPTAVAPGGTHTTETRRIRGHPPPKNKTPDGPLPQVVQQLCEYFGDPHGIREAHVGPPHPSKILPPNGPIFLVLEWRPRCRFSRGHLKKGESTEAFADGVTDVISKGVLHFINLPVGEGSDRSPKNKRKGGGVGAPADT